ncbi:MAG: TIGR03620 family F420-dependent LLM class oxidoreductase [Streptosporangiaceae bacterium]
MTEHARDHLGRFGVWRTTAGSTPELARAVEEAGYGTLWVGGSPDGKLAQIEALLDATTTLTLATGIVNIWKDTAADVAAAFRRIAARHPGRFLLGVGAGHREATREYSRPYETLVSYVDTLLDEGVPREDLVLAALGPKVLRLAAARTSGAHPYLVTPEHTRQAREIMGTGPLLAPEHKVVLDTDPQRARAISRPHVQRPYLGLVNYTSNLRRLGWSDDDLRDGGSDALIDALAARGTAAQAAARLQEHLAAGADHVCVQLLTESDADPLPGYRALATALDL